MNNLKVFLLENTIILLCVPAKSNTFHARILLCWQWRSLLLCRNKLCTISIPSDSWCNWQRKKRLGCYIPRAVPGLVPSVNLSHLVPQYFLHPLHYINSLCIYLFSWQLWLKFCYLPQKYHRHFCCLLLVFVALRCVSSGLQAVHNGLLSLAVMWNCRLCVFWQTCCLFARVCVSEVTFCSILCSLFCAPLAQLVSRMHVLL